MKRALICTVGVGSGIERPILKSIEDHNPDMVLFLVTKKSEKKIEIIKERYNKDLEIKVEDISNPDDIQKCYDESLDSFSKLIDEGFDSSDIFLNITSGTKPMSSGLALAGVSMKCGSLSYVTGDRDQDGRVKNGTERVYSMGPRLPIADSMLSQAKTYFNEYAYKSAYDVSEEVLKDNKLSRVGKEAEYMSTLSHGYFKWDMFKHSEAREIFKDIDGGEMDRGQQFQFGMNITHLEKCIEDKKTEAGVGEYLLVDIFANMERRIKKGEFDDAVARGYRCLEMLGQYLLWEEYGIHHADVKIDTNIFDDDQVKMLRSWRGDKDTLSVGLRRVWRILGMLDEGLSEDSIEEKGFEGILTARNKSILAHGSDPVSEDTSLKFRDQLKKELEDNIDDFERKLENGRHMRVGEM